MKPQEKAGKRQIELEPPEAEVQGGLDDLGQGRVSTKTIAGFIAEGELGALRTAITRLGTLAREGYIDSKSMPEFRLCHVCHECLDHDFGGHTPGCLVGEVLELCKHAAGDSTRKSSAGRECSI